MQGKRTMIPWKISEDGDFNYYPVCRHSYKKLQNMKKKNELLEIT